MPTNSMIRNAKNKVCNYTDSQIRVREATSNDPSNPSREMLMELVNMSLDSVLLDEMFQILLKRINDDGKNWRHISKSLLVFEFLCIHGNDKALNYCMRNKHIFESLKSFQYFDKNNRDVGAVIREKSAHFSAILNDPNLLKKFKEESGNSKFYSKTDVPLEYNPFASRRSTQVQSVENIGRYPAPLHRNLREPMAMYSSFYTSNEVPTQRSQTSLSEEIKKALPSTIEEEEDQLKIALALSKEEAERKIHSRSANSVIYPSVSHEEEPDLLDLNFNMASESDIQSFGNKNKPTHDTPSCQNDNPKFAPGMENINMFYSNSNMAVPQNTPVSTPLTSCLSNFTLFDSQPIPPSQLPSSSNRIVSDFLGDIGANLVDLSDIQATTLPHSVRPQYSYCNPFQQATSRTLPYTSMSELSQSQQEISQPNFIDVHAFRNYTQTQPSNDYHSSFDTLRQLNIKPHDNLDECEK